MQNTQQKRSDVDELMMIPSLMMPEVTTYMRLAAGILMTVLGWVSVTLEVFIRHSFGERYLNIIRVILAWQALGLAGLAVFMLFGNNVDAGIDPIALGLITPVFLVVAILQLIWVQIRKWRKVPWHTRSFGVSWLHPLIWRWDYAFYRLVEPAVCFGIGYLFTLNTDLAPIGGWICFASIALLLKNNIAFNIERERMLDIADAELEAMYMRAAMAGESKRKTAGISVVRVSSNLSHSVAPMDTAKTVSEVLKQAEMNPVQSGD